MFYGWCNSVVIMLIFGKLVMVIGSLIRCYYLICFYDACHIHELLLSWLKENLELSIKLFFDS